MLISFLVRDCVFHERILSIGQIVELFDKGEVEYFPLVFDEFKITYWERVETIWCRFKQKYIIDDKLYQRVQQQNNLLECTPDAIVFKNRVHSSKRNVK